MDVLVIGSGVREVAAVKNFAECGGVDRICAAPGCNGMKEFGAELVDIKADDISGLYEFAEKSVFGMTFVGPEVPLVRGIVDLFRQSRLPIFGPPQAAVRITEGSKVNCQRFCQDHGVAIAPGECFEEGDHDRAHAYIDSHPDMLVVKADGLCAGKGVEVARSQEDAKRAVRSMMIDREFGDAGKRTAIQKKLVGEEISFHVLLSRDGYQILCAVRDYKRAPNGKNSGGLGGKLVDVPNWVVDKFVEKVLLPTIAGFRQCGVVYEGVLYAGCMLVSDDLYLLEYNSRFGDPEMQVILAKLKTPLLDICQAVVQGRLSQLKLEYFDHRVVLVVGCTRGYPGKIDAADKGKPICGLVFAGAFPKEYGYVLQGETDVQYGNVVNLGTRPLNFIGLGDQDEIASERAYTLARKINFEGMWCLPGIGTTR